MTRAEFEKLVHQAIEQIPSELRSRVENVDIVIEGWAAPEKLFGSGIEEPETLLGLYEGIPLTERYGYDMVLPDKITLFQRSIESICSTDQEVLTEIQDTVAHEVAHHFGIGDEELGRMGV
mgnify:CR=1 FL=1